MTVRRGCAPALVLALAVAGCGGSSSMSDTQLRSFATRVCTATTQHLNDIPTPQVPSGGATFLRRGVTALRSEVTALGAMHPSGDLGVRYRQALSITEQELKVVRSSLNGLKAGNDPTVAMKTLQTQLAPLETEARSAYRGLGLPACAGQ